MVITAGLPKLQSGLNILSLHVIPFKVYLVFFGIDEVGTQCNESQSEWEESLEDSVLRPLYTWLLGMLENTVTILACLSYEEN